MVSNEEGAAGRVKGFIPVGWYPGALKLDPSGRFLFVANVKGLGSLQQSTTSDGRNSHDHLGSISFVRVPDDKGLAEMTGRVLANNRTLEVKFKQLLAQKVKVARGLCEGLQKAGELSASPREIEALATNMVVVATYWLSYSYVMDPRRFNEPDVVGAAVQRGCYQVMALTAPYLTGSSRDLFERLAAEYLTD